jgi:Beta-lactamase enzyme family
MVVVLGEIWHVSLLSPRFRALTLELLLSQRVESKVPVALSQYGRYAHKTGELDSRVENDAGPVPAAGQIVALAVRVEGGVEQAMPLVAAAVLIIYDAFAALR